MFGHWPYLSRKLSPLVKVLKRWPRLSLALLLVFLGSWLISFAALVFFVPSHRAPAPQALHSAVSLPLPALPHLAANAPLPVETIAPSPPNLAELGSSPLLPSDLPPPIVESSEPYLPATAAPDIQIPPDQSAASLPPPVAARPLDAVAQWRRSAVAMTPIAGRPWIAIVIDDMGLDLRRSARAIKLPGPLTMSFLPYGRDLPRQTAAAHGNGHELMVHVSMQPEGSGNNPGPNALTVDLAPD